MAETLWTFPQNAVGVNHSGFTWTNIANVKSSGTTAYCEPDARESTDYIKADQFDFLVPSGATITGVEYQCYAKQDAAPVDFETDRPNLYVGGVLVGLAGVWATGALLQTYSMNVAGGATDLWGETSLTPAQVNNTSDFGVRFQFTDSKTSTERVDVDYVQLKIHYTGGASGGNLIWPIT